MSRASAEASIRDNSTPRSSDSALSRPPLLMVQSTSDIDNASPCGAARHGLTPVRIAGRMCLWPMVTLTHTRAGCFTLLD
ncbi:hypothetical protein PsYK624_069510 [Phanerochaete sordida]|uniref:Uncharacterized protein n=1 Tax=Phanerochaete sordida TaxID=48140 RepID=A0A9P3LEB3_9APHY|nr:hypothetical protein PsYK624_069510 [Phanerochaete sordida]